MRPIARRRLKAAMWAAVVLASMGLATWGLTLTAFLSSHTDAFARDIAGHDLILLGAVASAAAATWARLADHSWRVTLAVAGPALLVGLPDLAAPDSLIPHLGALAGIPAAFAGMLIGLLDGRPGSGIQAPLL